VTCCLLDVNVLIALVDPAHLQHEQAHNWFSRTGKKSFATCPIIENGLLRIVGHPKYPNSPGPPATVAPALAAIRKLSGHQFWLDKISITDEAHIAGSKLLNHSSVTDVYLLALARAHGGRLATLDRRIAVDAVRDGTESLEII